MEIRINPRINDPIIFNWSHENWAVDVQEKDYYSILITRSRYCKKTVTLTCFYIGDNNYILHLCKIVGFGAS